jgi:type I restriction enzyme S subunit
VSQPTSNSRIPLKRIADIRLGKMLQPTPRSSSDIQVPYLRAGSIAKIDVVDNLPTMWASTSEIARFSVREGDLVVAEGGDLGSTALISAAIPSNTIIQNSLHRVRPLSSHNIKYVKYCLDAVYSTGWLDALCNRATFGHLTSEKLGSLLIPNQSPHRQDAIANGLERQTARIDMLIEKKRLMIDLLEQRWDASVHEYLSKLTPMIPLKRRWRVIDCKHRTPAYVDEGHPVVSPGDLSPGRIDLSACNRFVAAHDFEDLTEGRKPKRGDIIYSRNASAGIASYIDTEKPFCMGQDVCLITSRCQDQRFLMYALNALGSDQLEPLKIGSTITRVNIDQIGELCVPAPSVTVQANTADKLDQKRAITDALIAKIRRQLRLLRLRRQALITAAVTGELNIAGAPA